MSEADSNQKRTVTITDSEVIVSQRCPDCGSTLHSYFVFDDTRDGCNVTEPRGNGWPLVEAMFACASSCGSPGVSVRVGIDGTTRIYRNVEQTPDEDDGE